MAKKTVSAGKHRFVGNSSRGIIYKSGGIDFAEAAALEARRFRDELNQYLQAA